MYLFLSDHTPQQGTRDCFCFIVSKKQLHCSRAVTWAESLLFLSEYGWCLCIFITGCIERPILCKSLTLTYVHETCVVLKTICDVGVFERAPSQPHTHTQPHTHLDQVDPTFYKSLSKSLRLDRKSTRLNSSHL